MPVRIDRQFDALGQLMSMLSLTHTQHRKHTGTRQLAMPGRLKPPHNCFISHFHTLGKFSFLDSLSALKNPVFVLKIFKILKILISVINIWKLWTEAARQFDTKLMSALSLTHTHTTAGQPRGTVLASFSSAEPFFVLITQ